MASPNIQLIQCAVACYNVTGSAAFYPVVVTVTPEEYDLGAHYDLAEDAAAEAGYEEPYVVFEAGDAPAWLLEHFDWSQADHHAPSPHDAA